MYHIDPNLKRIYDIGGWPAAKQAFEDHKIKLTSLEFKSQCLQLLDKSIEIAIGLSRHDLGDSDVIDFFEAQRDEAKRWSYNPMLMVEHLKKSRATTAALSLIQARVGLERQGFDVSLNRHLTRIEIGGIVLNLMKATTDDGDTVLIYRSKAPVSFAKHSGATLILTLRSQRSYDRNSQRVRCALHFGSVNWSIPLSDDAVAHGEIQETLEKWIAELRRMYD